MVKNKKLMTVSLVLIAIALGIGVIYWYLKPSSSANTSGEPGLNNVNYGPPKESDKIQPSSKEDIVNQGNNSGTDQDLSAQARITHARQEDSTVYIRTLLNGVSGGTCNLAISKGSRVVTKSAPIGVQSSYAICQGFNIPVTEFQENGEWDITLTINGSNGKSTSTNAKITIAQ